MFSHLDPTLEQFFLTVDQINFGNKIPDISDLTRQPVPNYLGYLLTLSTPAKSYTFCTHMNEFI